MAVVYKLDGVELDPENVFLRWNNDEEFEGAMAADGTGSFGSVIIHDPDGTLDVQGWMTFTIDETDCTDAPRLVTAWIWERDYARGGDEDTGAARTITCQLLDPNALLSLRVITGSDGNRPAETDGDRVDWLLGSDYLDGLVSDTGYVVYGTSNFDSENEIGRYPAEVLASIASAGISDRVFFAFYDQVAEAIGLFFDLPTATTYDCTLSISNVPADLGSTCFPPFDDVKLNRNPDAVYSDVRYVTKSGVYNVADATTRATYFPSPLLRRGVNIENQRDGSAATSTRHAANYLAVHSTERDTITVTIRVPSTQVGLIQAGMRMSIRLSHCPGYETATWTRIERMSFHHAEGRRDLYDVTLSLTNKGLASNLGGSSGDPGDFPYMPSPTSVVQTGCGHALAGAIVLSFPAAVAAGDMLVAWVVARAGGPGSITPPTGWTEIDEEAVNAGTSPAAMFYKIADSSDDGLTDFAFTVGGGSSRPKGLIWELSGVAAPTHSVTVPNATGSTSFSFPSLTEGAGISIIGVGTGSDDPAPATITPSDHTYIEAGDNFWQTAVGADRLVAGGSQVYAATFTVNGGGSDYCGVAAFFPADSEGEPPTSGQEVGPETVTMSGPDGTTAFPFATGSLRVYVDNTDQTAAITAQDGAAGTFTLGFTPTPTETVVVFYQGR